MQPGQGGHALAVRGVLVSVHKGGLGSQSPGIWMELGAGPGGGQDGGVRGLQQET